MIFELIKSIIFGIVQGITEWLPISSTGHMLLVDQFLHLSGTKDYTDMFFTVIQFGSILAVVFIYFDKLNPFSSKKSVEQKKSTWQLWMKVVVASIPLVAGLLLDDVIHDLLYGPVTIAIMLILYGVLFIILENSHRIPKIRSFAEMPYQTAFLIGLCQVLAMIPGTSRSGATILGAVFFGCSRAVAAEFSFFMAIPAMFGASSLEIVKYIMDYGFAFSFSQIAVLLVGMIVAFVVSMFVIHFLMSYIRKHDFKIFGWYRIILGIIVLVVFGLLV